MLATPSPRVEFNYLEDVGVKPFCWHSAVSVTLFQIVIFEAKSLYQAKIHVDFMRF